MIHKIGVMDSGFGGLSVLNELTKQIPNADYFYYGDLKNSPYGSKEPDQVYNFCEEICDFFLSKEVNGIVIACNTATSVAIEKLRKKLSIPIFGMEPAIKPAVLENPNENIAVLATPLTLNEKKFLDLEKKLQAETNLKLFSCDGLASLIDKRDTVALDEYLEPIFNTLDSESIKTIVLGCTHYVHIKNLFFKKNPNYKIYDGNEGTVRQVARNLISIPMDRESKLDIFLNGGSESDFETAYFYLNQTNQSEQDYVK
jgi:glutamate racemase